MRLSFLSLQTIQGDREDGNEGSHLTKSKDIADGDRSSVPSVLAPLPINQCPWPIQIDIVRFLKMPTFDLKHC